MDQAVECVDILVFAGLFLPEVHDVARLGDRARAGCRVRVLLGDPKGSAVHLRGREEGVGLGMAHRILLSLRYYQPILTIPGMEMRLHDTTLYVCLAICFGPTVATARELRRYSVAPPSGNEPQPVSSVASRPAPQARPRAEERQRRGSRAWPGRSQATASEVPARHPSRPGVARWQGWGQNNLVRPMRTFEASTFVWGQDKLEPRASAIRWGQLPLPERSQNIFLESTLYALLVRADEAMLVHTHVYGSTEAHNPVLHLRRVPAGRVVNHYQASFDRVWAGAAAPDDIDALIATFDGR